MGICMGPACMGPAYHKGVPFLRVPGITLDVSSILIQLRSKWCWFGGTCGGPAHRQGAMVKDGADDELKKSNGHVYTWHIFRFALFPERSFEFSGFLHVT